MITLTDERGLIISPKSWDEIVAIAGYVKGIDPSEHKLKSIIGSYHLKDIHCGLICNNLHDKGYIAVTQSGVVTNMGHLCGQKYFGTDFTTFTNQYNREVTAQNNRYLLCTFDLQLESLEQELIELKEGKNGASWIYNTSIQLITKGKGCPDEIIRVLNKMLKARTNMLKKEREATNQEIEAQEALTGKTLKRPHVIEENITTISGLEVLYKENDLKSLIVVELQEKIKVFKDLNIENLSYSELSKYAKWINSIDLTKEQIKNSMAAGIAFLNYENLKPLLQVLTDNGDIKKFSIFLQQLKSV